MRDAAWRWRVAVKRAKLQLSILQARGEYAVFRILMIDELRRSRGHDY